MSYRQCRWYDPYPGLTFALKLISLMPPKNQSLIGVCLNEYLTQRHIARICSESHSGKQSRWYDSIDPLFESLEKLKLTPDVIKFQSTDFLMRLIKDISVSSRCA